MASSQPMAEAKKAKKKAAFPSWRLSIWPAPHTSAEARPGTGAGSVEFRAVLTVGGS
ncbi:hypothetical protein GCM10027447_27540 [Glycomyces halotolerans]